MNKHGITSVALMNAGIWCAASAAIGYAIKKTGSAKPLLAFLLVPRFTYNSGPSSTETNTEE